MKNYKLIYFSLSILLMVTSTVNGQEEIDDIDKYLNPPTGILLDDLENYNIDVIAFDGTNQGATISSKDWFELYEIIALNNPNQQILTPISEVRSAVDSYLKNGTVPYGVIDIEYNIIDTNSTSGYVYFDGSYFREYGNPNDLYLKKRLYLTAPLVSGYAKNPMNHGIPSEFYFSNISETPSLIEADFGDGYGFQMSSLDYYSDVMYYSVNQIYDVQIRSHYFNTTLTCKSEYKNTVSGALAYTPPGKPTNIETPIVIEGPLPYYIRSSGLHGPDKVIYKPFIIVEGIDYQMDEYDAPKSPYRIGDYGWDRFIEGGISQFSAGKEFVELLTANGYDVIYVDYYNGSQDLAKNGDLLLETLLEINDELRKNGSSHKNVIMGISMGGLVSRYALNKAEMTSKEHNTGTWITLDSPHKGANIPVGMQWLVYKLWLKRLIANNKDEIRDGWEKLERKATRQMLDLHYSSSIHAPWEVIGPHEDRIEMLGSSESFARVPKDPITIAIANGSGNGTPQKQPKNAGDLIMHYGYRLRKAGVTHVRVDVDLYSVQDDQNKKVSEGNLYYLGGNNDINLSGQASYDADNCPGGTRGTLKQFKNSRSEIIQENHCFVSTISALGISTDNYYTNIYNEIGEPDENGIIKVSNTLKEDYCPFDYVYASEENEVHAEVNCGISNAILSVILDENNIYLKDYTLKTNRQIFATNVYVGTTVRGSSDPTAGYYNVEGGGNLNLSVTDRVYLRPGSTVTGGGKLHARVIPDGYYLTPCNEGQSGATEEQPIVNQEEDEEINEELTSENTIQVFPNPFNISTEIRYTLIEDDKVNLVLFDLLGKQVRSFVSNKNQTAGTHSFSFEKENLPPGTYLVVLKTEKFSETKKVTIIE